MKKIIVFIITVVFVMMCIFGVKYMNYKSNLAKIKEANLEYETYLNKEITGRELTTAINRAVNNNEKNKVLKDEQGFFIEDDENSIKIDIKMTDIEATYKMETIYNGGMENFIQYYGDINFECVSIDYNNKGKVKNIVFEQKTT